VKPNAIFISQYKPLIEQINAIDFSKQDDAQLKVVAASFLNRDNPQTTLSDALLVEYFALVKEVAYRTIGLKPFDAQLLAAIAMHKGKLAEMQTGEGKTLAAVLPASLNALTGKSVHILTFNDYLAQRDFRWMGPIYTFLGLTVGFINETMPLAERQTAYQKDIVYLTAKEAGFDYLKNFLCTDVQQYLPLDFHYAIVDEADSILIDEARIPLVIAGDIPIETLSQEALAQQVKTLAQPDDLEVDLETNNVFLTDDGVSKLEQSLGIENLYDDANFHLLSMVNCALQAQFLLIRDTDYIVKDEEIKIVDQFTGRIAENRHYPDTLHNAVQAKENLPTKSNGSIMGSITLRHFISKYKQLAGMTGTALSSATELMEMYNIEVLTIPTNKPCIRKDLDTQVFTHKAAKDATILAEIEKAHQLGQPVLIGTSTVTDSETLSSQLDAVGIKHVVLNAKNDQVEAEIIAKAGELHAVTVSTNMAGRGVDIKLGGTNEAGRAEVIACGGLYVIGTNLHESVRIDNQLRGRAGRQGDIGKSQFFVSLEDEIMEKFKFTSLISHLPAPQSAPITTKSILREVARVQRIAQGSNHDARTQLNKYATILDQQREIITDLRNEILFSKANATSGEELAKIQLSLFFINKHWTEYLDYMSYLREGIHLTMIGGKNPLDEYHKEAIDTFQAIQGKIDADVEAQMKKVKITAAGIDMTREGLIGASSTWTYLINDSYDQFSRIPFLVKTFSTRISGMLFTLSSLFGKKDKSITP